jgi:hypothetical protein
VLLPAAVTAEADELERQRDALALLVVILADTADGVPLRPEQDVAVAELEVTASVERVSRRATLALDLDAPPVPFLLDLNELGARCHALDDAVQIEDNRGGKAGVAESCTRLSPSERQVADLVASGRSNHEVWKSGCPSVRRRSSGF